MDLIRIWRQNVRKVNKMTQEEIKQCIKEYTIEIVRVKQNKELSQSQKNMRISNMTRIKIELEKKLIDKKGLL